VRWQDNVADASADWTRVEFERGFAAFERIFGFAPQSHAAAGWQINDHALRLEAEHGLLYASDTRVASADMNDATPFFPLFGAGPTGATPTGANARACPQYPTTLPTFDELLGVDGIDESTVGDAVFERSKRVPPSGFHVFTLHAELEGLRLLDAFERLLVLWREAGAAVTRMATIHALAGRRSWPSRAVVMEQIPGRSGLLAVAAASPAAAA
jgi:peptidoglycan/xylan/chitin deacetylase (PgdA/CDA1 family)